MNYLSTFTAAATLLGYCILASGAQDCISGPSALYAGKHSVTKSGIPCQRWDVDTPHIVKHVPADGGHHNYCRNPDNDPRGPWCYTIADAKRWDYCEIPKCENAKLVWTTYYSKQDQATFTAINADPEYHQQSTVGVQKDSAYDVTFDNSEFKALYVQDSGDLIFTDIRNDFVGVYRKETGRTYQYLKGKAATIYAVTQDPVSGNVYYTNTERKTVMASDSKFEAEDQIYTTNSGVPRGVVILPSQRKLVFSVSFPTGSDIYVANMDGSSPTVLVSRQAGRNITALTADDQRIYWIETFGQASKVMSIRFNGKDVESHYIEAEANLRDIAVYSGYIYMTDVRVRYDIFGVARYRIKIVGKTTNEDFTLLKYGKPSGLGIADEHKAIPEPGESLKRCQEECAGVCLENGQEQSTCVCPPGLSFDTTRRICLGVRGVLRPDGEFGENLKS